MQTIWILLLNALMTQQASVSAKALKNNQKLLIRGLTLSELIRLGLCNKDTDDCYANHADVFTATEAEIDRLRKLNEIGGKNSYASVVASTVARHESTIDAKNKTYADLGKKISERLTKVSHDVIGNQRRLALKREEMAAVILELLNLITNDDDFNTDIPTLLPIYNEVFEYKTAKNAEYRNAFRPDKVK